MAKELVESRFGPDAKDEPDMLVMPRLEIPSNTSATTDKRALRDHSLGTE